MVVRDENPDVYHNLTESLEHKASPTESKWTIYLVLCCLAACASSFSFGFNIGVTNLPTQYIQDFYAQRYFPEKFSQDQKYLEKKASFDLFANYPDHHRAFNLTQFSNYFVNSIDKVKEVKSIQLTSDHFDMFLKNAYNETEQKMVEFLANDKAPVEEKTTILWIVTNCLFVIGGMVGAFTSKYVADFFGRKNGILVHTSLTFIGAVLVFIAPIANSPECVIISRFFYGIQGGMSCGLIPTYLAEISPSNLRGATGVMHQLFVTVGILVAQILGFRQFLGTRQSWHILLALPLIPSLIGAVCLFFFFPETPRALLINKRDETGARDALKKLRNTTNVSSEIDLMNLEARESNSDEAISIMGLFKLRDLRWPLITGLILQLTQQLSGINAIFFYSESIFRGATIQDEYIQYAVFATGFINVISTIICVPLIDRLGRKPLLVFPMILIIVDFIVLTVLLNLKQRGVIYSYLSIFCIVIFIMSFAVGLGPIPFIYVAECFRQDARSAALAVCMFTNWMANLLLTLTFPYLSRLFGNYVFLVFTGVIIIAVITIFTKVPETKGRSVDEIMMDFEGKKAKYNRKSELKLMNNTSG